MLFVLPFEYLDSKSSQCKKIQFHLDFSGFCVINTLAFTSLVPRILLSALQDHIVPYPHFLSFENYHVTVYSSL